MKLSSAWTSILLCILIPVFGAMTILYSDVQGLKITKADQREVLELKVEFTRQMTRNTSAIENLNETLKTLRGEHVE
jgi:hypothetical protein